MEKLKINETPRRTARNFRINNITLENIEIPEKVGEFKNIEIKNLNSKTSNSNNSANDKLNTDIVIDTKSKISNMLVYGLGETLTNLVNDKANANLKISIKNDDITNKSRKEKATSGNNKEKNAEKEAEIDFKFDKENQDLIENIEINAKENSKSTIILKYEQQEDIEAFHNGIIKTNAKKNSEINIILINLLNQKSNNFISIENTFEENAKINYTIVDFGGKNSITNYYSNMIGDNSDNQLNTIYLGKKDQVFDLNYIGELRGKKTNINIDVQGALKDKSKKHFKGTIDFKKGCKKAVGNESEACMLLSDTAKSIALPMLLCSEEEVEGNHSSSAGKIGEKELFYIMSRGFSFKEAMKLMVRARFNKILENIKNEELKQEIVKEIDEKLD